MTPEELNGVMTIPEAISYVSIKEDEAAFLYDFIQKNQLERTLETGLGFGRSAMHIMAAHGKPHIAIDPFQEDYEYLALGNIEQAGLNAQFEFFEDYSHNVLPHLARESRSFDFIFVDGDHTFDGILVDFYYADLLLEESGFIAFHDTWMRSTQLVASFIKKNKSNYRSVPTSLRNFLVFQKTGKSDGRDGIHFREFYTWRSRIKFTVISWLLKPGDSMAKRMVRRIKDALK